jgi:YegS/Rv2252/BmrU family lipid kinase
MTWRKIATGFRTVVAVGGDGTIHEVINGVMRSRYSKEVSLGIIPLGGGNDFVRSAGIPLDLQQALTIIKHNHTTDLDVGKLEDRYFINSMGIGFDAVVCKISSKIKFLNGLLRYLFATIIAFFFYKKYKVGIKTFNDLYRTSSVMITIGNGKFCGGGYCLTPDAEFNDGKLDVCLVKSVPLWKVLTVFPKAISGTHTKLPFIEMKKTHILEVQSDVELPVYLDGEIPKLTNYNHIRIKLIKNAIKLIIPSRSE